MKWPFYAYFLAFLLKVSGENIAFVYLIQFILGAISCVLVYLIAKRIFGRACAFIASLLCVWYGLFIFYEGLLIYTSLSIFLNLLFFLLLLYLPQRLSKKNLFLTGIFLGICTLTQGNTIIFGIISIVWLLWLEKSKFRIFLNKFLFFFLGLSLTVGLVTFRNYMVEKDFVLMAGNIGVNLYIGNNPASTGKFFCPAFFKPNQEGMFRDSKIIAEARTGKTLKTSQVSDFWVKKSLEFIKSNPLAFARLLGKKVIYLFSPSEFIHDNDYSCPDNKHRIFKVLFPDLRFILPLCILGLLVNLKNFKKTALLYFILITFSFSLIIFFVVTRYRIVMVPFMAIFAASAIISIWDAAVKKEKNKTMLLLLVLSLLCAYFTFIGKKTYLADQSSFGTYPPSLNKAVDYMDKGDYINAIKKLKEIRPPNHYSLFCFGVIAYNMKDFDAAEKRFKESIRMNPYFVDAYYNLGVIYYEQGHFAKARDLLKKAVSMDPENYAYHFELARSYNGLAEFKKAKEEFDLALIKINRWRTDERKEIEKELSFLINSKSGKP
ncbi:MAG: tetratricopeptide repeat protein [Candidatus Omnitrophota bacterium]